MYQSVFERHEKKYLLTPEQYRAITNEFEKHMLPDRYADSIIANIYYDTPDFLLIRRSLEKPKYKEKLRLRCYRIPQDNSPAFIEIKKKFKGVVYKRRICAPYRRAAEYLAGGDPPSDGQITHELDYFLNLYPDLAPRMVGFYHRLSYRDRDDPDLRVTIDGDILCRVHDLDISLGAYGQPIIPPDHRLMEIKTTGAFPLWLCRILGDNKIYPTSFSKYGTAYKKLKINKE